MAKFFLRPTLIVKVFRQWLVFGNYHLRSRSREERLSGQILSHIWCHQNIVYTIRQGVLGTYTNDMKWALHTSIMVWTVHVNKKVLLRERKRHTARCVASTPYVVLTGYPPRPGYPPARVPPWGVPPRPGYPPSQGTPPARVPPGQGTPPARVPPPAGPGRVPPQLPHGILGNVAKHCGIRVPPRPQVWTDKQSETITFPSYYVRGR